MIPVWVQSLWRQAVGKFSLITLASLSVVALVSIVWTPFAPLTTNLKNTWAPPGWPNLLGTDGTGRDILSILMAGSRTALSVALGAGLLALLIGLLLAGLGALTQRWFRESIAVLVDIGIAFPTLLLAMMMAAVWGGSLWIVILSVGIGFGIGIGRVTRPELRRFVRSDFMLAGRAVGLTTSQNVLRHLLPAVAPVFIVQLSWSMAAAVLAEAGLSYLGFGATITEASWGVLLADVQRYIGLHPLTVLWPGIAITITVLSFNLLGDALRDATDPTSRFRRAYQPGAKSNRDNVEGLDNQFANDGLLLRAERPE